MPPEEVVTYKQGCSGLGAMFVGLSGGAALGHVTRIVLTKPFFSMASAPQVEKFLTNAMTFVPLNRMIKKLPMDKVNHVIKQVPQVMKQLNQLPQLKALGHNNPWVRLGLQSFGTMIAYSYLECKFQQGHRRNVFDAGLAGAITGGAFGLRGMPGGSLGAAYGAAGFATYAALMQLFFR